MTLTKQQSARSWTSTSGVGNSGPGSHRHDPHRPGHLPRAGDGRAIRGRDGIRDYWQTKVVGEQANITCDLLNLYLDDGTAIAEWEATFDDTAQQVRKHLREVALLTFNGSQIDSLREYWASELVELSQAALPRSVLPLGKQGSPNGQ